MKDIIVLTASTNLDNLLSLTEAFSFDSLIALSLEATQASLSAIIAAYTKGNFCTRCGECCRLTTDGVWLINQAEVNELAFASGLSRRQFIKRYLFLNDGRLHLRVPCVFQKSNSCSIYNIRPMSCRFYPFQVEIINNELQICVRQCPGGKLFTCYISNEIDKYRLLLANL